MSIKNSVRIAVVCAAFALPAVQASAADQWHFIVKNVTKSNITNLEVSEDNKTWGNFDIGKGIAPGETAKLIWDASTNEQGCEQWLRAKFADGSTSEASQQDFCEDLDTPIEFSE
jgi:hypothetical protein